MRAPVYMICAALIVVVNGDENYYQGMNDPAVLNEEQDPLGFLFPRLMGKFKSRQWDRSLGGPEYYPVVDIDSSNDNQIPFGDDERSKRAGFMDRPSLSINNNLDVLRNRLLLEISRKKAMQGMNRNRDLLCKIGKRALFDSKRKCDESEKFLDDKLIE